VLTGVLVRVGAQSHPILGDFTGVSFTATDSYRLLSVGIPADVGTADGHGASVVVEPGACHSVLIPAASVKVGASDGLALEWDSADGGGDVLAVSAKGRALVVPIAAGAELFPNWVNLFGSGDSVGRLDPFAVNGAYLGGMLSDMAKAGGPQSVARIISAVEGLKPVRVDCVGDGFAAAGIVMPVRVPDERGVLGHLPTVEGVKAVGS